MEARSIIKWGLLAGGVYYLVRATGVQLPSIFPQGSSNDVVAVFPTQGSTLPLQVGPKTPAIAPTLTEAERIDLIKRAASGDAAAAAQVDQIGFKTGADGWNWYREQATGQITEVDLFTEGQRDTEQIGAQEYLRRRTAAGLSGLHFTSRRGWGA